MADLHEYTTKEVLNKVLLDSSGNAVAAYSHTSQEALNAVLDSANSRLNVSIEGGTISGDVTIGGDLTVEGDSVANISETVQGDMKITSSADAHPILTLEQTGNNSQAGQLIFLTSGAANDNDDSGVIRFKGMNDAGTPEEIEYATIYVNHDDVSDGSEDATMHFRTQSGGSLASRMVIKSSNVGIGTTAPDDYGTSASNLVIKEDGSAGLSIITGTSNTGNIHFGDGTSASSAERRGMIRYDHSSDDFIFWTAGAEKMRITSAGKILIGGDDNTGFYLSGANNLDFQTDGATRLNIDAYGAHTISGKAIINQPSGAAHTALFINQDNPSNMALQIDSEQTSNNIFHINNPAITTGTALSIEEANALTTGRIVFLKSNSSDSSARTLFDISNSHASATGVNVMKITNSSSNANNASGWMLDLHSTYASGVDEINGKAIRIVKNDGQPLANNDRLGSIAFAGAEDSGSSIQTGARIDAVSEGTWSYTSNPASLVFLTTSGDASQSEKMRISSAGDVHIPSGILQVSNLNDADKTENILLYARNAARFSGTAFPGVLETVGCNTLEIGTAAGQPIHFATNATTRMTIDSSGRVAIGTTSIPSTHTDLAHLSIGADASIVGVKATGTSSNSTFAQNAYFDGAWKYVGASSNEASALQLLDGKIVSKVAAAGTANNAITWIDAMTINSTGATVTGTTNLSSHLFVTQQTFIASQNSAGDGGTSSNRIRLKNSGTGNMEFTLENAAHDFAFTNGKVGINTVSPNAKLEINGGGYSDSLIIKGSASNSGIQFKDSDSNTDGFVYADGGNVGFLDADGDWAIRASANTDARFYVAGLIRFMVDTNSRISLSNNDGNTSNTVFGKDAFQKIVGGVGTILTDVGADYNSFFGEGVAGTGTTTTATGNVGVGWVALQDLTTGSENIAIGAATGHEITTGNENILIGSNAGGTMTTQDEMVLIGHQAGDAINDDTADGTVGIGYQALTALTSGASNTAIGYKAAAELSDNSHNTVVGYQAMYRSGATVYYNTFIGSNSGSGDWSGGAHSNTAVGAATMAGVMTDASINNVAVGRDTLNALTTGANNTAVGKGALSTRTDGIKNTAIGSLTLANNGGDENTAIGYASLNVATGGNNTALGSAAGDVISSGTNNTIIGKGSDPSANSATNQTVVGYAVTGVADNTAVIGNASVTKVYMAQDASDGTTQTEGAEILAKSGYFKRVAVDGSLTGGSATTDNPILTLHGAYNQGVLGSNGHSLKFVMQDNGTNNGETARIATVSRSGGMSSNLSSFGTDLEFHNRVGGTMTKQMTIMGGDSRNKVIIHGNNAGSGGGEALEVLNDGNDANREGIHIQAGKDTLGTNADAVWLRLLSGDGDDIASIQYVHSGVTAGIVATSDERLKENIKDTSIKGVETIDSLKLREFNWKSEVNRGSNKIKVGLIAQEVEKIDDISDMVVQGGKFGEKRNSDDVITQEAILDDVKSLEWTSSIPYLIKAVQELSARVKELESK